MHNAPIDVQHPQTSRLRGRYASVASRVSSPAGAGRGCKRSRRPGRAVTRSRRGVNQRSRRPGQDVAGPGHGGQDPPARVPRRLAARAPRRHRRVPSLHTRARTAHVPFLVKRVVKPVVKPAALLDTIGASPLHARARAHARTHAHAHAHACDMILSTNTSRF